MKVQSKGIRDERWRCGVNQRGSPMLQCSTQQQQCRAEESSSARGTAAEYE